MELKENTIKDLAVLYCHCQELLSDPNQDRKDAIKSDIIRIKKEYGF